MEEQTKQQQTWWQKHAKLLMRTGLMALVVVVIVLIILIILGYIFNWDWTGLNASNFTSTPQQTTRIIVYQPGKTLWDWLGLLGVLAIPVVVGFGVALFTAQQSQAEADRTAQQARESEANREKRHQTDLEIAEKNRELQQKTDLEIAAENRREAVLQAYIDKISELLLKEHLGERTADGQLKPEYEQVRNIARVRTITVLTQLDARRIGYVFSFLHESGLMSTDEKKNMVSLDSVDLEKINLSNAKLGYANLSHAQLNEADLSHAFLFSANLSGAKLGKANLMVGFFFNANMSGV